ncbi:hypothetical protein [Candidatus Poriferisocius sp.]|uniref:hypothetical protein n=1 Tax=Candidatus Poriferisocius sp. TaxID=3101276 RepID=UPI003B58C529
MTALVMVAAGCGGSGGGDEVSCVLSPGNDKYCLVEDPAGGGGGLKRVRALRDVAVVVDGQPVLVAQRGDLGGWVEGEEDLSVEGSAWVGGDAKVFGGARVEGDALVTGFAEVSDGAVVRDRAQVSGHAKVFGAAQVSDQARVVDAAVVCSDAEVYERAEVGDEAVVCGRVPRAFSPAAWAGAGRGAKAARMVAWVQGWSEVGVEPVRQRAGLGGTGAHVFGDAAVSDGAWVFEQAKVFGEAEISGQARVFEYAQVFDNSRVADQASVYGSALVFSSADSEYVSGMSKNGEHLYTLVFSLDDVARVWWTDSSAHGSPWEHGIDEVRLWLEFRGLLNAEEQEGLSASGDEDRLEVAGQPTQVLDSAAVFGEARVWGESVVLNGAEIEGWLSGGSRTSGDLCQGIWLNKHTSNSLDSPC